MPRSVLVPVVCALASCLLVPPAPLEAQQVRPPAEVVLVGTIHWWHLLHPGYTPAHLRALLARIHPDALAVESSPERQKPSDYYWSFLPEIYVAAGYAAARSLPVVGIDQVPADTFTCFWTEAWKGTSRRSGFGWIRGIASSDSLLAFGVTPVGIDATQRKTRWEFLDADARAFAQDSAAFPREDKITVNIARVAAANPGKRVAVLIGADHLFPQTSRLSRLPGIRLIESSSFLPLASAELDSAWRTADLPLLLGASLDGLLAIAAPHTRSPQRTSALLDRLVQAEPNGVFSSYYQARWHLTMGHYREAADLLEALLAKVPPDSLSLIPTERWSWPPFRHIYHKGLFLRGALYDLQGDHDRAARLYQQLLDSVPAHLLRPPRQGLFDYTDVAAYLRLLIREGFRGGATEAERSSDFRECGTTNIIPGRP